LLTEFEEYRICMQESKRLVPLVYWRVLYWLEFPRESDFLTNGCVRFGDRDIKERRQIYDAPVRDRT